jgi:tetratricopeptide (TPR) repeat protein
MNINNATKSAIENYQAGNLPQVENTCKKILKIDPGNIAAINLLGIIYYQLKNYDSALRYMKKIIALDPNNAQAYYIIGHSMQEKEQPDEAINYYQKALQINPDFADVYYNLGTIFQDKKRNDEAITCYQKALQIDHADVDACYNLGRVLQDKEQFDEAVACYRKALQIDPNLADAHNNIGTILLEKEQFDEAMSYCQKALQIDPNLADAYNNIGIILRSKEQLDEAMSYCNKALELNPGLYKAYHTLGGILQEKARFDEAITCYQKALKLNPGDADVHFGLGSAFMQLGNLKQGWKEYEWRWKTKDFVERSCTREPGNFSQPLWDGSSLKGKTLLIYSEQGVGDEIMFASCFQDVIDQAALCTVECDRRLIPIFSRSLPKAVFVERVKDYDISSSQYPKTDFVIPIGSLPKYVRTDFGSFPQKKSYLIPDAEKVRFWRDRLKTLGEGLKVGLSWRGGMIPKVMRKRSVMLERWIRIFSLSGIHFINLQYGDCAKEIQDVKDKLGVTIHDWEDADPLKDLDNFAAQISALDLVISVDNSTVHMAGALGAPVWVLLPFACDWRWMREFEDTPWYPAMRLFRQGISRNWDEVFDSVCGILEDVIEQGGISSDHWRSSLKYSYMNVTETDAAGPNEQILLSDKKETEKDKYMKAWGMDNRIYARYSPGLELSNQIDFLSFFRTNDVKTVLDAGIGSGKLCKKMIGMGFECYGLDIADNSLDDDLLHLKDKILTVGTLWDGTIFKEKRFDATVCMDVLEHIPTDYIDNVIDNLVGWTKKYLFLQIALFHDHFGSRVGETLHLTVKPKSWWDNKLSGYKIIQDLVLKDDNDVDVYVIYLIEVA